ncbi:MAG: hypothetical protein ACP5SA_00310 [Candidatus Micrarchaeia archaeon]
MKAQTTFEFIIILVAVASFSAFLLGIYSHMMHDQQGVFYQVSNSIEHKTENITYGMPEEGFSMKLFFQNNTYVGIETKLQVALYIPNGERVNSLTINATNAATEPKGYYNITSGVYVLQFDILALKPGIVDLNLTAILSNKNVTETESAYALAYAQQAQQLNIPISASIKRNSEYVEYNLSKPENIYNIGVWSHCSYVNFWGNELPIKQECGNSASWYFWVGSWYCTWAQGSQSDTMTYCFYKEDTNATVSQISKPESFSYNITLFIGNNMNQYESVLLSNRALSSIVFLNRSIGNAIVENVSGATGGSFTNYLVLKRQNTEQIINATNYLQYEQVLLNAEDLLSYYNSTSTSSSTVSQVLQSVSSLGKSVNILLDTANTTINGCILSNYTLYCKPSPYLYYTIDAVLDNANYTNATLDYEGSTIKIS